MMTTGTTEPSTVASVAVAEKGSEHCENISTEQINKCELLIPRMNFCENLLADAPYCLLFRMCVCSSRCSLLPVIQNVYVKTLIWFM